MDAAVGGFSGVSAFIVYSTWAAFQGNHYEFGPYLSPFYSPLLFGDGHHAWFGPKPGWWPAALPFSAALLILWAPGGFRFTCYYYRGAYYKAFWAGSAELHGRRAAEVLLGRADRFRSSCRTSTATSSTSALFFIVILTYDAIMSFRFAGRRRASASAASS